MRSVPLVSQMLFAVVFVVVLSKAAWGLGSTDWIDAPLPPEYRSRAVELLKKVRPKDTEQSVDSLKARLWQAPNEDQTYILMRVESDCQGRYCMTLMGRVSEDAVHSEFILQAGPTLYFADVT